MIVLLCQLFSQNIKFNRRLSMQSANLYSQRELKSQNKHIHYKEKMKYKYFRTIVQILSVLFLIVPTIEKQAVYSYNEIINGNFSQPHVTVRTQVFSLMIKGWHCRTLCEIKNCQLGRAFFLPLNSIDSNCNGQVMDLNSHYFNQLIYQQVKTKAGIFLLQFSYYYPLMNSNKKSFEVTFNRKSIFYFHPQMAAQFQGQLYSNQLQAVEGINNITFQNFGFNDGSGFKINNVSLQRKINVVLESFMELFFEKAKIVSMFPGMRTAIRSLFSFMINFDRLELYIYHNRTYSYHSELFLRSVNQLLEAKSKIVQTIIDKMNSKFNKQQDRIIESFNKKDKYIQYPSFRDAYKTSPYFTNLNSSFIYFLPFILASFIVFNFLFQVFYNQPVSLFFRKFSLWGLVFVMIFDGNIEELTFFTFSQFRCFFSRSVYHKFLNFFIVIVFSLTIIIVFALPLWFKFHYGRKSRYLFEEQSTNILVIVSTMVDRGIICVLFGLAHQLLLSYPNLQISILIFLQLFWILKKIMTICVSISKQKVPIILSIVCGLFRISFQITWVAYQKYPHKRLFITEVLDQYLILGIFCVSILEMIIGSMIALCQGIKIIFWNRDTKISDISLRIHKNQIGFLNSKDKKYKTIDGGVTVESLNQKGTNKRFRRRYPFIYKLIYVFTKEK